MRRGIVGRAVLLLAVGLAACVEPAREPEFDNLEQQAQASRSTPTGALRWAHQITGEAPVIDEFPPEKSGRLARDGEDHVLVLYNFTGTLDLGDRQVRAPGGPGSDAIVLARYDQRGRLEWVKLLGTGPGVEVGGAGGLQVAVDSHRNILLHVGASGADLGDGQLSSGEFLVKLDCHGRLLWKRSLSLSGDNNLTVFKLLTDRQDRIALAGRLQGTVDFGHGPVSSKPYPAGGFNPSAILALFSPAGEIQWAYVHSQYAGEGTGATVDSQGHFILCGDAYVGGSTSAFALRLSPDGALLWDRYLQGPSFSMAWDVATHGNRVVLTGTFEGRFTFRRRIVSSDMSRPLRQDAFLLAYTRDGEERWARAFGFSGSYVAMDQQDGVVAVGTYEDGDDLGLGRLPSKGENSSNLYVAKYDRVDGRPLWIRGFPSGLAEPFAVAVTKDGRSVVLGSFRSGSFIVGSEEWPQKSPNDLFLLGLER